MRWNDAVVVVTGGSRGIGLATARAAAARGAHVGLIARDRDALIRANDSLAGRGEIAAADLGDEAATSAAFAALVAALGPVDVLVCAAGIGAYGPFQEQPIVEIEQLFRTNVLGPVHAVRAAVGGMIEHGGGHIVLIGSIAGKVAAPLEATYSATKFAVDGLADALGIELARYGIGVSVVNPGPVDTGFFEARGHEYARRRPRPVAAERVAAAVLAAVDHRRAEITVPRWLRAAIIVRAVAPSWYRRGARSAAAGELATTAPGHHDIAEQHTRVLDSEPPHE
jgi:short-subunit dehydrogenase